jgi:hypothetical protein
MDQLKRFKEKAKRNLRIGTKKEVNTTERKSTGSALSFQSGMAAADEVKPGGDKGIGVKGENLATRPDDPGSTPQPGAGKGDVAGGIDDTGEGASQDDPGPHPRPGLDREGRDGAIPPVHPEIAST